MLENLFIPDDPSGTTSNEIELSEDINSWPMEIQNAVLSSVPILADAAGQLVIDAVDPEKLYAKGSYVVDSPDDKVIFPIIIKAGKMAPVDLFIYKGKWYPVDPQDLTSILTSAQIGTGLIDEQDIPPTAASGMRTKVNPPGSYGTGSGIVSTLTNKISSANPKIAEKLVQTIQSQPAILRRLAVKPTTKQAFLNLLEPQQTEKKAAAGNPFKGNDSVIISLGNGNFAVKYASKNSYVVEEARLDGNTLAGMMKEAGLDTVRILSDIMKNKYAFSWDDTQKAASFSDTKLAAVTKPGRYWSYISDNGKMQAVPVDLFGYVKTASGAVQYLTLNSNDTFSLQEKVAVNTGAAPKLSKDQLIALPKLAADIRSGDSVALPLPDDQKDMPVRVLPPVKIAKVSHQKGVSVYTGDSDQGKIAFVVTDEKFDAPVHTTTRPDGIMVPKEAAVWFVPSDYPVYTVPAKKAELVKSAADFRSAVNLESMQAGKSPVITPCSMWKVGSNSVALKLGANAPKIVSDAEAMLFIKKAEHAGVADSMSKLAAGIVKKIDVLGSIGADAQTIKETVDSSSKKKNINLEKVSMVSTVKVAATFDDEEDIDTVLSLNYMTPENMAEFSDAVPEMKKTEDTLARLLMSTRLGNTIVEESDVKNVLTTLHSIVKELETAI